MKKSISIMILAASILFCNYLFGQSRTNAPLPIVTDTGVELDNLVGWRLNEAGQWQSGKNFIPGYSGSYPMLHKFKLYTVVFNNAEYVLFAIVLPEVWYRNPGIKEGAYTVYIHRMYLIEKQDFTTNMAPNVYVTNSFKIFAATSIINRSASNPPLSEIQTQIAPLFQTKEIQGSGISVSVQDGYLKFYSYFFQKEGKMRFVFHDYNVKAMSENQYYECTFTDYFAFFSQISH